MSAKSQINYFLIDTKQVLTARKIDKTLFILSSKSNYFLSNHIFFPLKMPFPLFSQPSASSPLISVFLTNFFGEEISRLTTESGWARKELLSYAWKSSFFEAEHVHPHSRAGEPWEALHVPFPPQGHDRIPTTAGFPDAVEQSARFSHLSSFSLKTIESKSHFSWKSPTVTQPNSSTKPRP